MKKKLVIMSEALGGGVRRHIIDLIENLDKDAFDIYFMYNLDRADSIIKEKIPKMSKMGINIIEINSFNREVGINDIKAYRNIYKELKRIKPDIVHCHSSKAGALGRIAAKRLGISQIYYTPHAYYFQNPEASNLKKKIYAFIEAILSKYFTSKTINVSNGEKEIALSYKLDDEEKFCVIYNGIEDNRGINKEKNLSLKKEFGINKGDIVVGVIARLNHQKDPNTFIDIAKEVSKEYKNIKFIYVGDGDLYDEIKTRVGKEKIENVILTGFRKDTEDILNILDIFLTTALYEGMPYALIEALRAKLAVIATNTIGNNEIVIDKLNGYLIDIKDIRGGYKRIKDFIENADMIEVLGEESFKAYKDKFSIEKMILEHANLYNMKKSYGGDV